MPGTRIKRYPHRGSVSTTPIFIRESGSYAA
jgi:hypothetical protein